MRILHILDSLDMGGIEVFLMNLYRSIDRSQIQFDFLIFKKENYFEEEVKSYGSIIFNGAGLSYMAQIKFIANIIRDHDYNIVHCHNCSLKGLVKEVLPVKLSNRQIIVIAHSHNTGTPSNTLIDKIKRYLLKKVITNCSDYLFACSYKAGVSKFIENKRKPIAVIKNGINTRRLIFDKTVRKTIRKQLNIKDDEMVFGTVGRLETQKNHKFLLMVYKEYLKTEKYSKLLIVGNGEKWEELHELVDELEIRNNVIFTGNQSNVNSYLMAMDIFVFPSLYEGLGIAVIEAQASGLPCLVADNIPQEAEISDLFHRLPLKIDVWINALKHIRKNMERSEYYRQVITSGYDINVIAKELSDFYSQCSET